MELKSIPPSYLLITEPTRLVNRYYTGYIHFGLIPCKMVTASAGSFMFRNLLVLWQQWTEIQKSQPYYKDNIQSPKFQLPN